LIQSVLADLRLAASLAILEDFKTSVRVVSEKLKTDARERTSRKGLRLRGISTAGISLDGQDISARSFLFLR
jgi:hypothetical protein